jgi:hypothetical protein
MCTSHYVTYTCGCKKEMLFEQCAERRGTIVKCNPVVKVLGKEAENYCQGHLVFPDVREAKVAKKGEGA